MNKKLLCMFFMVLASLTLSAQVTIKLWPNGTPNNNGVKGNEKVIEKGRITNVSDPEMLVFPAENPNGFAIIDCPGGAYRFLSMHQEGIDMAPWFNSRGYTYVVLKYRMPNNGHWEATLSDIHQAIKLMRQHTDDWKIRKVGVMGASAGGHLASTAATHYGKGERPDFQILLYPVITMNKEETHMGTRLNLLGDKPTNEMVERFSNELQVTADTPPAFIMACFDDNVVPVINSIHYFEALLKNKVACSLHIYPKGGHGFGYYDTFPYKDQWLNNMDKWLRLEVLAK